MEKFNPFGQNKNLLVIAIIAVVNALGYGIIIPILYSYSMKYGLTDFQNGLLFASFSVCQFISTPFIGRYSDKFGRKPLLLFSLFGTIVSFILMAFAPNAIFLFVARMLDGLSAGNIPVASAVIADTTDPKDRAKGFGIIGAAFGFGFIAGPAISGLTYGYGAHWPFLIAASITGLAMVLTWFLLPETNPHIGKIIEGKIFDFNKLVKYVVDKYVGKTLIISLLYALAFGLFVFAFQPFSVKTLKLSPQEISAIYIIFGIVGVVSQMIVIPRLTQFKDEKQSMTIGLALMAIAFFTMFLTKSAAIFIAISIVLALGNSIIGPMLQAVLSKEAPAHEQGAIQGVNASYNSIGFAVGPILGGLFAMLSIQAPFVAGAVVTAVCVYLATTLKASSVVKANEA